jgi:hypothetical protein
MPFIGYGRFSAFKLSKFGLKQNLLSGSGKAAVSVLEGISKCNSLGMGGGSGLIYF